MAFDTLHAGASLEFALCFLGRSSMDSHLPGPVSDNVMCMT
jgi:hypothetical protein